MRPQPPLRAQGTESQFAGSSVVVMPDGRELWVGGISGNRAQRAAWFRDPQSKERVPVANLTQARAWQSATLLPDGRVLVLGGVDERGRLVGPAEVIDVTQGTSNALPELHWQPRAGHSATLVDDNTVVVAGGLAGATPLETIEAISLEAATATPAGTLDEPRAFHSARLLASGGIELWGGSGRNGELETGTIIDLPSGLVRDIATREADDALPWLAASAPEAGASGVSLQPRIMLRFSRPPRRATVSAQTITLAGPGGAVVNADVVSAENGRLAFVTPTSTLDPLTTYLVSAVGLRDKEGTAFPAISIVFTTAGAPDTQADEDDETWDPSQSDMREWRTNKANSRWQRLAPLRAAPGVTALSGQVLRLNGTPLAGVTLRLDDRTAVTDQTGRFLLINQGLASGPHELIMDGRTANRRRANYGTFVASVQITAHETSVLPFTIWMPKLDVANAVQISSPTTGEIVVTTPKVPGLELRLPRGTVISDDDGRIVREVSITPIPIDRPPFPLPATVDVPIFFTIQPGGAYVAVTTTGPRQGARLIYPNYRGYPAGKPMDFWHYEPHEGRGWYVYGRGAVTPDRQQVAPDPGVFLYKFTGAMIAPPSLAGGPAPGPPGDNGTDGDPVHLGTGQFVQRSTDLALPDLMPIGIDRAYRTNDSISRSFGIGATHQFDMFLTGTPYTTLDLVLPDGTRVRYNRVSSGTGYTDAIFEHTSSATQYFKSRIYWNGIGWNLDLRDGSRITFPESLSASRPAQAAANGMRDRYNNSIALTRNAAGDLTRVTSPNGRWIELTYDANHRVTQARDNANRIVQYVYDASGRLWKVTNPAGGVTEYTYDTSHRMLTIKDPRGNVFLTNEYNAAGRVVKQTQADGTTYLFAYTLDGSGRVTQTDVTNPRGHVRRVTYNTAGYLVSDTSALGQTEQRTLTNEYQTGTNLPVATIDALNRRTEYAYDAGGNLTSMTKLAGTADAVTYSYTYEPTFQQLATSTDPLDHTTTFTYDASGRLTTITDPLSQQTTFTYNGAGQPITVTTPAGTTQLAYEGGDLVTITDPGGGVSTRFVDAVGRMVRATNALGQATRYEYDALNRVTTTTDARGGTTTSTYDANGNMLTLTDAQSHTTTYTYNNMDRLATRTDPLTRAESYTYDANGNLQQVTDRKSQVTTYTIDPLNRTRVVTYHDASTRTFTYDAGDRLTQVADSIGGTITRTWDLFDRLTGETTPEGSVGYTYDAAGRRVTMTVAGQTAVNYAYDAADRVTGITQGTASVGFTYDSGNRRTQLTLPNGITVDYGYDASSRVTGLTYKLGASTLGTLTYTYDAAGRRTSVGGSWARTGLPAALTSATYDAANQIASWSGSSFSYDANGNMTSDGARTYTWNARNQLTALAGGASAAFNYDGLGRRRARTVGGTTTGFLYDGGNPVQELSGATASANLLTGLNVDEIFTRTDTAGARSVLADALGSTMALADATGTVQTQYTFDPFGTTTTSGATSSNAAQFTGRENDGTGLYFNRARYYSPSLQRWISEDPIEFAAGDVNLYGYVGNQPTTWRDPSGLIKLLLPPGHPCRWPPDDQGPKSKSDNQPPKEPPLSWWLTCSPTVVPDLIPTPFVRPGKDGWPRLRFGYHETPHPFGPLGRQPHLQLDIWWDGVPGSNIVIRIPIPRIR
jgi:RHS repeat-associated protein